MAEFKIKNYNGQLYLKEDLKRILNSNPVWGMVNRKTILLYCEGTGPEELKESLETLLKDVNAEIKFGKKKDTNSETSDNNGGES